jgi:GNAT superfamily N-acetyltransferase
MPDSRAPAVRRVTEAEMTLLFDLRWRVLRPGRSPNSAHFEGDDLPTTIHLGAFAGERLLGIATLIEKDGLQLRGMATEPDARGSGAGAAVVREAERIARESGLALWCNARAVALGFYEKMGWRIEGDEFDVPDVGPHFVMRASTRL